MKSPHWVKLYHRNTDAILLDKVRWCANPFCRMRGLQFHRILQSGEGLVLFKSRDSIQASSIHMLFVFFPIAAVWINSKGVVVHKVLAKPWRLFYASPAPASAVLETTPDFLDRIAVGDRVDFQPF